MRSLNKNGLSGKRSMQVNPWVCKNMEVWWVRLISKKAACWSLAVRSSSWSNVVWMNLRNNWQTPRFGSDANSNLSRSRGRPAVHRKRWKRSVPEPLISRPSFILLWYYNLFERIKKNIWNENEEVSVSRALWSTGVHLPLPGSHRESDDSAGWTKKVYPWLVWDKSLTLLSRSPRSLLWEFYSVVSCCKLKIYRYGPCHTGCNN